jgi:hypothetical protein
MYFPNLRVTVALLPAAARKTLILLTSSTLHIVVSLNLHQSFPQLSLLDFAA